MFQLILGRSGTGKSEYIFNDIKKNIDGDSKIYIITPEQFSFTAEKKLLDSLGKNSVTNAEVINFNRIATRVFQEVGGSNVTHLTNCGKNMLMFDILNKSKNNLKVLTSAEKNISVAVNAITEFKKQNVQNLDNIINEVDDELCKLKLEDLSLIYKTYNENIQNRYIDENDVLNLLAKKLVESKMFENSICYIDEFIGFTEQEYKIIQTVMGQAGVLKVALRADVKEEENLNNLDTTDLFYEPKKTAAKLLKLARTENIEIENSIILKEIKRYKNNELQHLENNIDKKVYNQYEDNNKNIVITLAKNPYSEVEVIAKNILKLVRDEDYKYNQISVICKNLDTYSSNIKAVFSKYDIPVFVDEKKDMNQNIIAKYLMSILEVIDKNWSYETVANYIKNPLADINIKDVYKLEKYILKWGIRGNKWAKEFKYEDEFTNTAEKLRLKVYGEIFNLKENIKLEKTFKNITILIYKFMLDTGLENKIENCVKELEELGNLELANEYKVAVKVIFDVLDEIVMIFDEQKTGFEKYKETLKIGLESVDIGKIPANLDSVTIGDVERSRAHKSRVVFIIGLNDGIFPSPAKEEGFLNDKDREIIKRIGFELAAGTLEQIYKEQLNVYKAFTIAEEKLFLSYSSSDKEGGSLRPSMLVHQIKRIFPKIVIESNVVKTVSEITSIDSTFDDLLLNLTNFKNGEHIDSIWFDVYKWYEQSKNLVIKNKLDKALKGLEYSNVAQNLTEENIEIMYGEILKTSVSKLEQYRKCPFSYFLKYGIKIDEQEEFKITALDTGSFMHEVIDEFFEKITDVSIRDISDEEINNLIELIIDKKLKVSKNIKFSGTAKYVILVQRLKNVVKQSIKYIIYQLRYSNFKILGTEVEFKDGKTYPSIRMELDTGKNVEITGKIDRVDILKIGDEKYIRIIDYKSSIKDIDIDEVLSGVQIQLLTYLDCVTEAENALSAGAFYFNLIDPIVSGSSGISNDEIENEIKNQFKMRGLILANVEIIKQMDNKLQKGFSDIIPVEISKDGEISKRTKSTKTKEEFDELQTEVRKIVKNISKEMLKGNIEIKPYKNRDKCVCEYCNYKAICRFNPLHKGNEYFNKKRLT